VVEIQQGDTGGWLAATAPGRLIVVQCLAPTEQWIAAIWAAVSEGPDAQPVLERLTANGLLATPAFALLEWAPTPSGRLGRLRCIVRGSVSVTVDTPAGNRSLTATGVSTWLEQLVDDVSAFSVDLGSPADAAPLLPLQAGAAWVSAVRASSPALQPGPAATISAETVTNLPDADESDSAESGSAGSGSAVSGAGDSAYDHLFGATMMRSVEEAAVRAEDKPDDAPSDRAAERPAVDVPAFVTGVGVPVTPSIQDDGDHDGMTVFSGDISGFRESRSTTPPATEPDATPQPTTQRPRFVLQITGGATEPLNDLVLVGRAPSVSKVSGGRVPRLVTVGGADQDISRNHVQFEVEGDTVVVTDLHSRNGTMIVLPGKAPQKLRQGEPTSVIVGTLVDFGGGVTMTVGQQ